MLAPRTMRTSHVLFDKSTSPTWQASSGTRTKHQGEEPCSVKGRQATGPTPITTPQSQQGLLSPPWDTRVSQRKPIQLQTRRRQGNLELGKYSLPGLGQGWFRSSLARLPTSAGTTPV